MRGRSAAAKPAPRRRFSSRVPVGLFSVPLIGAPLSWIQRMTSGLTVGPGRRRALSPARHARPRPHSSGRGLRGPDATVFRVAGFRLLQAFSAYLGIDTTTTTTTTGSCPAAMHYRERSMLLWSGKWVRGTVLGDQHG